MENPQRRTSNILFQVFNSDKHFPYCCPGLRQDGGRSNQRVILCLGLLNFFLLIIAVVIGINCAKVKDGSFHVSHPAVEQLISELNFLRSNHSDVIEAEEESKKALERALRNHTEIKEQIEQLKTINDGYQKQIETLQAEKTNLKSNISALEGSCGRCLPGWILFNTSCYFFSYSESSDVKKKWPDSRADCISRGADLVVIDDQEEQKFVSDSIENMKSGRRIWQNGFWIGLTDTQTEGTWVWINNVTEVEQRYWIDGEPNGYGQEDCGATVYNPSNPWQTRYDVGCDRDLLHWVCEMPSR